MVLQQPRTHWAGIAEEKEELQESHELKGFCSRAGEKAPLPAGVGILTLPGATSVLQAGGP